MSCPLADLLDGRTGVASWRSGRGYPLLQPSTVVLFMEQAPTREIAINNVHHLILSSS